MPRFWTANRQLIRAINRSTALNVIKAEGPISKEVLDVMSEIGISSSFFYVRQMPDVSPRGSFRTIMCRVHDLRVEPAESSEWGTSLRLSFKLEKGCYATAVLREYMKAGIGSY